MQTNMRKGKNIFNELPIDNNETSITVNPERITRTQQPIVEKICIDDAYKMVFPTYWNVWTHSNSSNDWTLNGYNNIMTITNVAELWKFLNSFNKINYMEYQIFVMRGDIKPVWEDPENLNGGAATIKLKLSEHMENNNILNIWEYVCVLTLNQQICEYFDDVNGISFNLKKDLTVIKIWNKDYSNDFINSLSNDLLTKCSPQSIAYTRNNITGYNNKSQ